MTTLTVMAIAFLIINILIAGTLLAQVGESRTFTYGQRWFSTILGLAIWGFVLYTALNN